MPQLANIKNFFLEMDDSQKDIKRIWNLLRTDIMRTGPKELKSYFSKQTCLKELGDFGNNLVEEFPDEFSEDKVRTFQEELVIACLEMDASYKFEAVENNSLRITKKELGIQLDIWRKS